MPQNLLNYSISQYCFLHSVRNSYKLIQLLNMASITKRKQQVQELRKAHFPFGFQNNSGAESEYIERYKEYQLAMNAKLSNNARTNNFTIGDGNTNYTSQFKEKFPEHSIEQKEDPSKQKKLQADKNFVFGYDGSGFNTNYKDDFIKKNGQLERPVPVNQRQPHISLGDSLTPFTTTYNQTHDRKEGQRVNPGDPNAIRKSNMILGNDKGNFQTQSNATYTQKPINNYHNNQKSNVSSINLGMDGNKFISENRAQMFHKDSAVQPVDKERIRDFKNAHFHFGFPNKNQFQSEAQAQYSEKPIDFKKAQGNRDSNFDLNVDGNNYFGSTYNQQFMAKDAGKRDPLKNNGQIHSVMMGADDDPDRYLSEAKSQFGLKDGNADKSSKVKPSPTIDIGKGQGSYLTHNQDTYQNRFGLRQNNHLTNQQINRLKMMNYSPGFQNSGYDLSSGLYGKGTGATNKLSKETLDAMKNTNIVQGNDNSFKNGTTYKACFHWKKNEDE